MRIATFIFSITFLLSCTSVKIPVSDSFSGKATRYAVKGLNGWMFNQKLTIGPYQTSSVKRGWDFIASIQYSKFRLRPEEYILRVLHIDVNHNNLKQKNKFQYAIEDGHLLAEVYATEKFSEKQLHYKSNNPWIGSASKTKKYEYAFTAVIIPVSATQQLPWSVVLINRYDISKDTARGLLDRSYVEEEGYATNGIQTISINPIRSDKLATSDGKNKKVFGSPVLSGYELRINNEVVALIDLLDSSYWLYNDLQPAEKLICTSITSSIFLKRMQDVEKDRDELQLKLN